MVTWSKSWSVGEYQSLNNVLYTRIKPFYLFIYLFFFFAIHNYLMRKSKINLKEKHKDFLLIDTLDYYY